MSKYRHNQMTPRNGHTLVVGVVARISGCPNQKELSLTDQEDHAREVIAELYDGPVEYRVIATKGKGEALDRPELVQIEQRTPVSRTRRAWWPKTSVASFAAPRPFDSLGLRSTWERAYSRRTIASTRMMQTGKRT